MATEKPRYKEKASQRMYENMLTLASDLGSELYYNGNQHRGASHRCAFWDGFSGNFTVTGPKRSAQVIPGTLSAVCFMAGREFSRRQKALKK